MPVVIPTHESAFQQHVQAAGCVTINLQIIKVNGRETHQFSLSTPSKNGTGRHVMLYSRTKPEPKVFNSLRALQTILAKLGFQVAEIPVQAGSWQCFLPDVSRGHACLPTFNRSAMSQSAPFMPQAAVAMAQL